MPLSTTFTQYAHKITKFGKNYAKWGPFRRSRSFKVTDIGTNRKLIIIWLLIKTIARQVLRIKSWIYEYARNLYRGRHAVPLQTFTTRHSNRKLSIVMPLSTTFTQYAHEITKFGKNYAKWGPFRRSRSFKVTDFGTNRKLIYDFLLVINTNLPPILHRFGDTAFQMWKIAIFRYTLLRLNPPTEGFPLDDLRKFSVDVNGWPRY